MAEKRDEEVIEGPGFIIRDRRQLKKEEDIKRKAADTAQQTAEPQREKIRSADEKETRHAAAPQRETEEVPLPEVNFSNFIFSLVHSAMLALGVLADPVTGKIEKHLSMAKHIIDTIGMLQQKTQGNLTEEEQRLMDDSLFDLRIRYVKEKEKRSES